MEPSFSPSRDHKWKIPAESGPIQRGHVIATRYDKTKESYLGFVTIAAVKLWLPFVHEAWLLSRIVPMVAHPASLKDGVITRSTVSVIRDVVPRAKVGVLVNSLRTDGSDLPDDHRVEHAVQDVLHWAQVQDAATFHANIQGKGQLGDFVKVFR